MSEGADSVAQTCGDSLTTLADESLQDATTSATTTQPSPPQPSPPQPPPTTTEISYTRRRPRCGTGGPPPSPYMWIDGRQLRSALVWVKKPSEANDPPRRVSFPLSDNHLVTGYLEPANPWRHAENVSREELIFAYKESCARHNTEPLQSVLVQLENLDITHDRCEELNLEGEILDQAHCEPLEEILKRVQFNRINVEGTSLSEESSIILFDMLEYYESTKHINISSNPNIGPRGWQACSYMIKKTQCLEQLEARDVTLNEQYMNILNRALRLVCHLHVLKLENCGLSGRAIVILVTALKMNSGLRELYLADNGLDLYDAIQLGSLLRMNNHLQLLDISNNNVQDDGVRDILEGLINQVNEDKTGKGLSILILWNNRLTKKSSPYFSRIIALSKTLETLNIGQNTLTDEVLSIVHESLKNNRVLLQLGMQSTELTCDGIVTLAEIMETNQVLQRIDLRDNSIQMRGMHALVNMMKRNKSITQIDLDDKPRIRIDAPLHQYVELLTEIRSCCSQNEERRRLEESAEDAESPQHPSRLLNASSRKISLTCQTLPCSSRPAASLAAANETTARSMLEPKRTSGGRLRSPAPSPIPSPVASPIPSPSRNRFVVCRVPEASLRSADSSTSSSPVTPPSLGSSPTCLFTGGSSGVSRFRVSVVESVSAGHSSSPKSVVTSPSGNVTIGFNFKVSADSGNAGGGGGAVAAKTVVATRDVDNSTAVSADTSNNAVSAVRETSSSRDRPDAGKNDEMTIESGERDLETRSATDEIVVAHQATKVEEAAAVRLTPADVDTGFGGSEDRVAATREDSRSETASRSDVGMDLKSGATVCGDTETTGDRRVVYTSTKELQVPAYPSEDTASARISVVEEDNRASSGATKSSSDDVATGSLDVRPASKLFAGGVSESSVNVTPGTPDSNRTVDSQPQERASTSVQRHKSSLEKLLSLFQYPGSLFSDSASAAVADTRASLQENVSGVMALGDKLQQYLKEGRAKVSADSSSWSSSSEHGSPLRNRSIRLNASPQLQSLSGIFASFKLDPHASLVEQSARFFGQAKNQPADINEEKAEGERPAAEVDEIVGDDEKNFLSRERKNRVVENDERNLAAQESGETTRNDGNPSLDRDEGQAARRDEKDCACCERNLRAIGIEENLTDRVAREDERDVFGRDGNRVTRNDESGLLDQGKNRITRNAESNLFDRERNRITRDDGRDLFGQGKNQVAKNNEQKSLDRVTRNDEAENAVNREKREVSGDENHLYDQGRDRVSRTDEKDPEKNREIVGNTEEEGLGTREEKNRVVKSSENQVARDANERDLKNRQEEAASSNEVPEDRGRNEVARSDGEDATEPRDARVVNVQGDSRSARQSQWTESDRGGRPLPESVQSKDDFANEDLVLESRGCVATTIATVSSSPSSSLLSPLSASKFTACVAIKLTDIPEYSVLELSQADGTGRNDAKRSERSDNDDDDDDDDDEGRRCRDAQDSECVESRDEAEDRADSTRVDPRRDVECDGAREVSGCNDTECSERDDDAAGGACAATETRTCDTTTTDSINQTSDSSFPICNIARDSQVVDSLSAADAPATSAAANDGDVGGGTTTSALEGDDAETARDVDLNDQVTSSTRRVADEDHRCDFMRSKEEEERKEDRGQQQDPAEVLDDACRGSAHCRSTSLDIKLESSMSATTTSPVAESRDAPEMSERLCRERQLSMPNNVDIHRSILKDAAEEAEDPAEDVVDDDADRQRSDPTILVTPYEEVSPAHLDKSDADELIFCMTDISTDGTSVEDELSPGVASRCSPHDVAKVTDSYFELPMATTTSTTTTLLIGHPEGVHRNSQDSGIDETAITIDDSITADAHPLPPTRGSLQESVDSGIESECSSICIRVDSAAERTSEVLATSKRSMRNDNSAREREDGAMGDDEDDDDDGGGGGGDGDDADDDDDDDDDEDGEDGDVDFGEFASDFLAKEARLVDNDSGIACSYLNSIKCAVVSAARPVAGMASSGALGVVVADEGVARPSAAPTVIAHSPAAVHGTSPK